MNMDFPGERGLGCGEDFGLGSLIDEREDLREVRNQLDENIDTLKRYALDAEGFVPAAREQALRLESIGLFAASDQDPRACPVCSQPMDNPVPSVQEMRRRLTDLNAHLEGVVRCSVP